jgi:hypothetical protein
MPHLEPLRPTPQQPNNLCKLLRLAKRKMRLDSRPPHKRRKQLALLPFTQILVLVRLNRERARHADGLDARDLLALAAELRKVGAVLGFGVGRGKVRVYALCDGSGEGVGLRVFGG